MQSREDFFEQVKEVLSHLYDYPYLQTHPLADELAPGNRLPARERMRFLRTTILQAIDELNPGPDVPIRSLRARAYGVLSLHYVEGLMTKEMAKELAISVRQAYRDLRKAERHLATLLWVSCPRASENSQEAASRLSRAALVRQEAERARGQPEEVCVRTLVQGVMAAVDPLARQSAVQLEFLVSDGLNNMYADRQILRQALVTMLSRAVQNARPQSKVMLSAESDGSQVRMRIQLTIRERSASPDLFLAPVRELVTGLSGQFSSEVGPGQRASLLFSIPNRQSAVLLVIDDNAELIELFSRYLAGQNLQLIGARNGREGLRLAEESAPDVVVLDLMMPHQDGWEILQRLQNQKSTRHIPVIVCSVLDDPELAYSLGAAEFLAKPVSRAQLFRALSGCLSDTQLRSHPGSPAGTE